MLICYGPDLAFGPCSVAESRGPTYPMSAPSRVRPVRGKGCARLERFAKTTLHASGLSSQPARADTGLFLEGGLMSLPRDPRSPLNLEQQRKRAKDLRRAHQDGRVEAAVRIGRLLPRARRSTPA